MIKRILFFLILALTVQAEDKTKKPDDKKKVKDENLVVTSRHLDYDNENRKAIFMRDVKAVNGETIMNADKMTVFFDDKNDPYLIIAEGKVIITKGEKRAEAEKGVYKLNEEIIILKHSPKLFDGRNTIKARIITFYEKKNVSEFEDPICHLSNGFKDDKKKDGKEDKKEIPKK